MPAELLTPEKIRYLIIHSSATSADTYVDRDVIDRWHRERGWFGIGYHFVIKRNGEVQAGRPIDQAGAHTLGYNRVSLGINMVGGADAKGKAQNNFTDDQWEALGKLITELREKYPKALIRGHRDMPGNATECPSFDVQTWVKETLDEPDFGTST